MAKEIKFTDEELKSLSDLAQGYQTTQAAFGQLRVQKILLSQQKDALEEAEVKLESDYIELQQNEQKIVKEYIDKDFKQQIELADFDVTDKEPNAQGGIVGLRI